MGNAAQVMVAQGDIVGDLQAVEDLAKGIDVPGLRILGQVAGQQHKLDIGDLVDFRDGVFGEHLGLQPEFKTVGNALLLGDGNMGIGDDDKLDFLKGKADIKG